MSGLHIYMYLYRRGAIIKIEMGSCFTEDILIVDGDQIICDGCLFLSTLQNTNDTYFNLADITSGCGPYFPTTPTAPGAAPSSPPASGASSISIAYLKTSVVAIAVGYFVVVGW